MNLDLISQLAADRTPEENLGEIFIV